MHVKRDEKITFTNLCYNGTWNHIGTGNSIGTWDKTETWKMAGTWDIPADRKIGTTVLVVSCLLA